MIENNEMLNVEQSITEGIYSVLYKRINNVTINDIRIRDAFVRFVKDVECGTSLSVAEILYSSEAVLKKGEINENSGNYIFAYDSLTTDKKLNAKLIKNSVGNVYSLFALHNGVSLDINAIGGSLKAAEAKRFAVLSPKKASKLLAKAKEKGLTLVQCGEMLATNKIVIKNGFEMIEIIDKSRIDINSEACSITLGQEHFSSFVNGYLSACSVVLCDSITNNNVIRFAIGGDINNTFARALGYYCAITYFKALPVKYVFTGETVSTVAVPRPNVKDGDYLYLLKVRNDQSGMPDMAHLQQLLMYLADKKRAGIIKDVLPVRENIQGVFNRLCSENITYEQIDEFPVGCFGIIVSVSRGDSVNGIKLGFFKYN